MDADPAAGDVSVFDELSGDGLSDVGRYGESDARSSPRDQGVDAHDHAVD